MTDTMTLITPNGNYGLRLKSTTHPMLYKRSGDSIQEWRISVEDNVIITRWGKRGGAIQETRDVITSGKNLGKANETSPLEQALAEAASLFEKKLKKGYVRDLDDAVAGKVDAAITGGVSPMLAHRFDEQGHKLQYPCYVQPKLDGHRCIAMVSSGKCTLWSRTRKPIASQPHIVAAIESLGLGDVILDGELYRHDYRDRFEELTSFIRSLSPKRGCEVVEYHIYDVADTRPFRQRNLALHALTDAIRLDGTQALKIVETVEVSDEDDLMDRFNQFLAAGYEGAMARNRDGLYVNKRSYDLLKIKEFLDSEFRVVAVESGRGKLEGHAIFVCVLADGVTEFRAKLVGDTAALKMYYDAPETAIGRMLTVKYQGVTKNGIPRFPIALRFAEAL